MSSVLRMSSSPKQSAVSAPMVVRQRSQKRVHEQKLKDNPGAPHTLIYGRESDADIRCATKVAAGQSFSVWCGERDGSLTIRDTETHAIRARVPQEDIMNDYAWCILQEGDYVWVGMSSGRLRIYGASSQQLVVEQIQHAGGIYALASFGDFVYSGSNDFTIREWHQATWEPTNRILGEHTNQVRCLCASAGYLVSGGDDHVIHVWQIGKSIRTVRFQRHESILALASVPQAQDLPSHKVVPDMLWAGDSKGELSIYNLQQSKCVGSLQGHTGAICSLLQQHGFLFSSSVDKTVKVWAPAERSCLQTFNAHASYVAGLLPIAVSKTVHLWSFGGDKKVCSWSFASACPTADNFAALREKSQRQARQVAHLTEESEAAQSLLKSKGEELAHVTAELEAQKEEWSKTLQHQRDEIDKLSTTLVVDQEVLKKAWLELEELRDLNCKLEQDKRDLRCDLENVKQEHRSQLEREQCEKKVLASNAAAAVAAASEEIASMKFDLQELCEKYDRSQQELSKNAEVSQSLQSLQEKLSEEQEFRAIAEQHNKELEQQLSLQDSLKTSRLGFVTEVWALHKIVAELELSMRLATKCRAPTASNVPRSPQVSKGGVVGPDLEATAQNVVSACNQSSMLIAKYLTDDEKLHLGIPLARYEGGHESPQPLEWSAVSEMSTVTSLSGEWSSASSSGSESMKVVKQQSQGRESFNKSSGCLDVTNSSRRRSLPPQKKTHF